MNDDYRSYDGDLMPIYLGPRDPIPAGSVALADLGFDVATQAELDAIAATEFELAVGAGPHWSNVNWATMSVNGTDFLNARRATDNTNQNNEVVFELPRPLLAGTWTIVLCHRQGTALGIYTVSVSPDASAWTNLTTIDGYAGAGASTRSAVTGLTIAAGMQFIRLKMATKNASSSAYQGLVNFLAGMRTGA